MPTMLNRQAYRRLIEEDVAWLKSMPKSLERDHIEGVLWDSIEALYERPRVDRCRAERVWDEDNRRQTEGLAHGVNYNSFPDDDERTTRYRNILKENDRWAITPAPPAAQPPAPSPAPAPPAPGSPGTPARVAR